MSGRVFCITLVIVADGIGFEDPESSQLSRYTPGTSRFPEFGSHTSDSGTACTRRSKGALMSVVHLDQLPLDFPPPSALGAGLLVVMPALNEQDSVARVIGEVRAACPAARVLVVDDGSTDLTGRRAAQAGAAVLKLPFNLGVGGAMRAAYRWAHENGYAAVVQVDADGQHDPRDIADLAALTDAEIVIGARFAGRGNYEVTGPRRWAMRLLAAVLSRIADTRITDPTSGFRLVRGPAVALFAKQYPEEYLGDTVEALVIAHRAGLRIRQVPVAMRPRETGTASTNPLRSAVYLLRVVSAVGLALARRRTGSAQPCPAFA